MPTPPSTTHPARPHTSLSPAEREARIVEIGSLVARDRGRYTAAAWRILRDPVEAEDAVQDALASACRKVDAFRDQSQLSTWLYRIVINAALMRLRTRRRRPETGVDDIGAPWLPNAPDHHEENERRELQHVLLRCAADLAPSQRELLMARYLDDTSLRSLAGELGITEGGVKARLHRARAALRAVFFAALGPEPA